jgi:hypothetical protein
MEDLILVLSSMFISSLLLRFFSCSYCLSSLYRLLLFLLYGGGGVSSTRDLGVGNDFGFLWGLGLCQVLVIISCGFWIGGGMSED